MAAPRSAQIIIDVKVADDTMLTVKITSRPMIPSHDIAEVLEGAAREIRAGRLDQIEVRPIET